MYETRALWDTWTWLENFLSGRTQQVILDGCHSDILPVTSGVPQGTILASLLFVVYS